MRERREGHQGGFVASWWREGEARERLGGSRRWPGPLGRAPRLASVRPPGRGGRGQGGGGGLGRAGPVVAPGKWLEELGQVGFSLFYISVLFYFI